MIFWKIPPIIKVYEALGAVIDGRVELVDERNAHVASSDASKWYDVLYDPDTHAVMTNDNGSYWVGYLGYPAIAFLMVRGRLSYDEEVAKSFKDIAWKKINQKNKNDFEKTMREIFVSMEGEEAKRARRFAEGVLEEIEKLCIGKLGKRKRPPITHDKE